MFIIYLFFPPPLIRVLAPLAAVGFPAGWAKARALKGANDSEIANACRCLSFTVSILNH